MVLIYGFWNKLGNFGYSVMYIHIVCFGFTIFCVSTLFFSQFFCHPRRNFVIGSHRLIWNKIWKYANNGFIENIYFLVNIITRKNKLPINLVCCSSYSIYISSFKISNYKPSYGGGYTVLRLTLQYVIWWWQFSWRVAWTLLSTTKLGWSAKIRS